MSFVMNISPLFRRLLATLLLLAACLAPLPLWAGGGGPPRIVHGGYLLERDGRVVAAQEAETPFIPASIWKIATGLYAITVLGKDFRFETRCFHGPDQVLYVQGSGDPMLTSEEVASLAARLRAAGVRQVQGIVLDDSAFRLVAAAADGATNTLNPYDVANSGLAVNFNTIHIGKETNGTIRSAEPETPTLPVMIRLGKGLPPGTHRINVSRNREEIGQYAGELIAEALRGQGIAVNGPCRPGTVPARRTPIVRHLSSTTLGEAVRAMLQYSNNFIANQLFLACGARRFGGPATWEKGREALTEFLREKVGLAPRSFTVEEGSGLSRKNRLTPRAMLTVLKAFQPYASLMPLRDGVMVKSGTLNGVYSYAGYFQGSQGLDPFVLILNQPENSRDRLLRYLESLQSNR
jgi:D-alanyl-D-alanine carboxypeptidase/D-alanyl-D-alanine-endopeptidase (penicillin-binding protein 4)